MAERRMFAKSVVLSDSFLDMPSSARALYYCLGMTADDDGFVNNPKSIMRQCGAPEDDLKLLVGKGFVILFDSGVIAIRHWQVNNYIKKDRYRETLCIKEKRLLALVKRGGCGYVSTLDTQDSIGEDSIGKVTPIQSNIYNTSNTKANTNPARAQDESVVSVTCSDALLELARKKREESINSKKGGEDG